MRNKTIFLTVLLFVGCGTGIISAQEWYPIDLQAIESRLHDLKAQVATLDDYSPEKFPDFNDLEKANQLVELLEFDRRKFDLLIKQYNLVEDEILPYFLDVAAKNPGLRGTMLPRLTEYTGEAKNSILLIQKDINQLALQIERLEKKIERLGTSLKGPDAADGQAVKWEAEAKDIGISAYIQRLLDQRKDYRKGIDQENKKLTDLREKEKKKVDKIKEKGEEITALRAEAAKIKDPVKKAVNLIFADVREIRLNGLEIPQLNTAKTFIYLSETRIGSLQNKIATIDRQVTALQRRRSLELRRQVIRGGIIILVALAVVLILSWISRRVSQKILQRVEKSESIDTHHKQRYQTLSSVILSFIKILLWILTALWVLGELNINYAPFLVAAGGISLAIGFGAQSLVKDVVSGFFILMEEQFALGDVVEIDGKTGTIEKISLRTVKFRSIDGTLHIIPNGSIDRVSNATHQWSRAAFEIGVSYDEDPERVLQVLKNICREFYVDSAWRSSLIDEPEPQGILSFGQSAINFRVIAKTAPGMQWAVEREMRIRIKKTFDREGIEIPYQVINVIERKAKT